jgi:hypothetical protein
MGYRAIWLAAPALVAAALGGCESDQPPSLLGVPCTADGDCGELLCIGDEQAEPDDLDDERLVCGRAAVDAAGLGEACSPARARARARTPVIAMTPSAAKRCSHAAVSTC